MAANPTPQVPSLFSVEGGFSSIEPDAGGGDPDPVELSILKREDFSAGALADKPWIDTTTGNEDYIAIRDYGGGEKSIRHMLNSDYATDPITGKLTSGLQTHTFRSEQFYDPETNPSITFEQYFKVDDSHWHGNTEFPYPEMTGKLFLSDTVEDSNAIYLGLAQKDNNIITLVSQNGATWAGWTERSYGWKNGDGTARNNMYLLAPEKLFTSDGVTRRLTFELQYNPGSIGHHKGRLRVGGQIMHDSAGINTDANGWFNLPIEYHLSGSRIYAAGSDIKVFEDVTTHPETYSGYAGGYEVSEYTIYEGVIS